MKAHLMCSVKTNVVTVVEIHEKNTADAPVLPELVGKTSENFKLAEVSADKGYSAQSSHEAIAAVGAVPYIAFKHNANGKAGGLFGQDVALF